jgi:hypothetical protein
VSIYPVTNNLGQLDSLSLSSGIYLYIISFSVCRKLRLANVGVGFFSFVVYPRAMDKHKYIREDRARERWDVYLYSVALYILDRSSGIKEEVRAEASCNMNMKDLVTGRRQPKA